MTAYRKKPVVIESTQWFKQGDHPAVTELPPGHPADTHAIDPRAFGWVPTLEGGHVVTPGDWIITGVKGENYPCKPDIFAATYEPAASPAPAASKGAEAVAMGSTLQRVMARLADMLDDDQFNNIETIIKDAGLAAPSEPEAQKAVAWGIFARIEGEWALQFPVYGSKHLAQRDTAMFQDRVALEIRPLYSPPSPAASMEVQGLDDDRIKELAQRATGARSEVPSLMGRQVNDFARLLTRALAAKNGWRLGEGQ